jgi:hypothetical protein
VIKRRRPNLRDNYGHWWIEIDDAESYGWWPAPVPVRLGAFLFGSGGALNGVNVSASTPFRDPHHGDSSHYSFNPTLVVRRSDWQVRRQLRAYARSFAGSGWRWTSRRPSANCRSFQLALLDAAGLVEGKEFVHTRGFGCWFLLPFRTARCWTGNLRRGRLVRHTLGGPCGCAPLGIPPVPTPGPKGRWGHRRRPATPRRNPQPPRSR